MLIMSKFIQKPNTFTLFINKYKKTIKQPTHAGKLLLGENKVYTLAGWKKEKKLQIKGTFTTEANGVKEFHKEDTISFNLEKNLDATAENNFPHLKGSFGKDGVEYTIGGYKNISPKGTKYVSGKLQEKRKKQEPVKADSVDDILNDF